MNVGKKAYYVFAELGKVSDTKVDKLGLGNVSYEYGLGC